MIIWKNQTTLDQLVHRAISDGQVHFYRDHYATVSVGESIELESLPPITREDLVAVHPDDRCFVPSSAVSFMAYTSGTTSGKPLVTYFASVDNYHIDPAWGMDVSRLLIVFPPLNKNFGGSFIQQCRQAPRPITPVFADVANLASSAYLGNFTKCDALYATPSLAFNLAPYLAEHYSCDAIKLLVISGETIGESKLAALQALYPQAKIANLYASSEIGQFIMGPTPAMLRDGKLGFRLLTETVVAAELIDDELVVTYALNKAFPLIRYRTGDNFVVDEELTAQYGDGVPVLQWAGKGGVDVVRVHGFEIRAGSVDDFFGSLDQHVEHYQLHVYPGGAAGSAQLKLECVIDSAATAAVEIIEKHFQRHFKLNGTVSVADAIAAGAIDSALVVPVPELSHQGNKRRVLVSHL